MNNHNPQFKIHGVKRRAVKKELARYKSFVSNFWYCHGLEKDMAAIYGAHADLSDEKAKADYERAKAKVELLEMKLAEPFSHNQ